MDHVVVVGSPFVIYRWPTMFRILFHIFLLVQVLTPFIMAHIPVKTELEMVVLYAHGVRVPLTFRMEDDGLAYVTLERLSLWFGFREDTISVEENIFDDLTSELTHMIGRLSQRDKSNNLFWSLYPDSYRVYGLTDSQMAASTEILTPRCSSTCAIQILLPRDVKVKLEPGLDMPIVENVRVQSVITLSSDEEGSLTKPPP